MARIQFRGKVQHVVNVDGSPAYSYIAVPVLQRRHCDMQAFREHPKYHGLANSDLFAGVLAKIRRDTFPGIGLRLDNIPSSVTVNVTDFLAVVTLDV